MKIAVVGGTGLVGRKIVELLIKKQLAVAQDITIFASKKSAGKVVAIGECEFKVKELKKGNIKKYGYAFFCAGKSVSLGFAKHFIDGGAVVIDNSSAFRRKKGVPLVVPEINMCDIKNKKLISNPNCSTIGASLVLHALGKQYKIKRVIITTFQAVSGAGQLAIQDLQQNTATKLPYCITNNLIPQIDIALKNGYTYEEDKMLFELKKILKDSSLKIATTCVRVPIANCHSESINVEFEQKPSLKAIKRALEAMSGVRLIDDLARGIYPMPLLANGQQDVLVGRIRHDTSCKNAVNLFICFDNILKGASLNAVQIMQKMCQG